MKPYPNGQDATKHIFPFAEIIAVADAYDNLIAHRQMTPVTPEQAIRALARGATSAFNVEVVALLARCISIFPTGSLVRVAECSNPQIEGLVAALMKPNPDHPHHPLVIVIHDARGEKTTPRVVDLSAEARVRLELVL